MEITNAQFTADGSITAMVDGVQVTIPADAGNRHYAAMVEQGIKPKAYPKPTAAERLTAWRNTTEVSKADFVLGLILLEILTLEDAIGASRGNWPTALAGFLGYLTPEQSAQVQIEWATRTTIGRMDTYVLVLGSYLSLTDEQLDGIFGG